MLILGILIFLFFILITFLIKIDIVFRYLSDNFKNDISIKFMLFKKIVLFKHENKENDNENKEDLDIIEKVKYIIEFYKENHKSIEYFLKHSMFLNYNTYILVGTGEPFWSGIVSGIFYAVVSTFSAYIFNTYNPKCRKIDIKTDFTKKKLLIDFNCIFRINLVNIIYIVLKRYYNKFSRWNNVRTSNRRSYDNCNAKYKRHG